MHCADGRVVSDRSRDRPGPATKMRQPGGLEPCRGRPRPSSRLGIGRLGSGRGVLAQSDSLELRRGVPAQFGVLSVASASTRSDPALGRGRDERVAMRPELHEGVLDLGLLLLEMGDLVIDLLER